MERFQDIGSMIDGDEFEEQVLYEIEQEDLQTMDVAVDVSIAFDQNPEKDESKEVKKPKKRRANLTEFDESQSVKRKNESAKRELTSIVNQVCVCFDVPIEEVNHQTTT